jgi:hypothetical protein
MRDKFEYAYAVRHMTGTPEDVQSIRSLRDGSGYSNSHIHDCWYMFYTGWAMSDE